MNNCKNDKKPTIIMIIGTGHSGSTLLDMILSSHSQIFGVGEISHYSKFVARKDVLCSCGRVLYDCEFWNFIFSNIDLNNLPLIYRNKKDFIINNKNYYSNLKNINFTNYIKSINLVYKNILSKTGKSVICDSSKSADRAELVFRNNNEFNFLLIHLVRDGRGVLYSNTKLGRKAVKYIKKWGNDNIKCEIIKRRNKNIKNVFVLYEDLVLFPEKVLSFILKQINLEFEPQMLLFNNQEQHKFAGNSNVWKSGLNDIKLDEKWKMFLSLKEKILFLVFFGWLNFFYKVKLKRY